MNLIFKQKFKGRILFVDKNQTIRTYQRKLYISSDTGVKWTHHFTLKNHGIKEIVINQFHILSRLFRFGYHHLAKADKENFGIIFHKNKGLISNQSLIAKSPLNASRPLSLEYINGKYVFGEYRSNPERSPIPVIGFNEEDLNKILIELKKIRHIHGVYRDSYTNEVWITTGDFDEEAALYCIQDNFRTIEKILSGSQQTRAIKLLFTEAFVYFGSDAPDEVNYLYRMQRENKTVEKLQQVGSSVFHGCKVANWLFFSTAVEPSQVNTTKYAEVWASPDGKNWKCLYKFKKDRFPMRFFQYGQVFFPNGEGDGKNLWLSPFATSSNNKSFKVSLDKVAERFE